MRSIADELSEEVPSTISADISAIPNGRSNKMNSHQKASVSCEMRDASMRGAKSPFLSFCLNLNASTRQASSVKHAQIPNLAMKASSEAMSTARRLQAAQLTGRWQR